MLLYSIKSFWRLELIQDYNSISQWTFSSTGLHLKCCLVPSRATMLGNRYWANDAVEDLTGRSSCLSPHNELQGKSARTLLYLEPVRRKGGHWRQLITLSNSLDILNACCIHWQLGPSMQRIGSWNNGTLGRYYSIELTPNCRDNLIVANSVSIGIWNFGVHSC